jgi:hypothetical protein
MNSVLSALTPKVINVLLIMMGDLMYFSSEWPMYQIWEKNKDTEKFNKITDEWAPVTHACNPTYSGGRSGGSQFRASPGK